MLAGGAGELQRGHTGRGEHSPQGDSTARPLKAGENLVHHPVRVAAA